MAPAFALLAIGLTVGIDLWRGAPAPLPAPAMPLPAVADHAPLVAEAWRDPFQVKTPPRVVPPEIESPPRPAPPAPSPSPAPSLEPRASPVPSPASSPRPPTSPPPPPPPVPPYPVYSGTLVGDGRPALVLEEGLAPVGQRIGPWTVVKVEFDRVVLETKQWRVTLDPEGKEIVPPERRK
jgi:hypothetical protein